MINIPLQMMVVALAGWINEQQLAVIGARGGDQPCGAAYAGRPFGLSSTSVLDVPTGAVYLLSEADFRRMRTWCAHAPVLGRLV